MTGRRELKDLGYIQEASLGEHTRGIAEGIIEQAGSKTRVNTRALRDQLDDVTSRLEQARKKFNGPVELAATGKAWEL